MMNLDVMKNESFFYGQEKFMSDSIMLNSIIEQQKRTPGTYSVSGKSLDWNIAYVIKKKYPDYETFWDTAIERENLLVEEDRKPNWIISNETKIIEKYHCQKATLDYGGRKWTAWFTKEIPIPEGPYKFYGLPGLIVKMEDRSGTHQFLLKGNKKLSKKDNTWDYIEGLGTQAYGSSVNKLKINGKQYTKLYQEYQNDPVKNLKQELARPGVSMIVQTGDGRKITETNELIRYYEEEAREKMKRKNNPIEFY